MTVKTNVLRSVVRKTGSLKIRLKVWMPTKSKLGCPAVTSLNA